MYIETETCARADYVAELPIQADKLPCETTQDKLEMIRRKAFQVILFLNHPEVVEHYQQKGKSTEKKLSELRSILSILYKYR
jgi:hypothetical protein